MADRSVRSQAVRRGLKKDSQTVRRGPARSQTVREENVSRWSEEVFSKSGDISRFSVEVFRRSCRLPDSRKRFPDNPCKSPERSSDGPLRFKVSQEMSQKVFGGLKMVRRGLQKLVEVFRPLMEVFRILK